MCWNIYNNQVVVSKQASKKINDFTLSLKLDKRVSEPAI